MDRITRRRAMTALTIPICAPLLAGCSEILPSTPRAIEDIVQPTLKALVTLEVIVADYGRFHDGLQERRPAMLLRATNGSGFFMDRSGRILTNAHVIDRAITITAITVDGRRWSARVLGSDPMTDLAVLATDMEGDAALALRDGLPDIGEAVAAFGTPFGYAGSVSTGIVSGVNRSMRLASPAIMVQHTAMINPGSSGGPVVDRLGRVVGVNTAIPDGQFEFAGISLAVDAPTMKAVTEQIALGGNTRRPDLGITLRALDPLFARAISQDRVGAAIVQSVRPAGPCDRAGLQTGDRLVAVEGVETASLGEFLRVMAFRFDARPLPLRVMRGSQTHSMEILPDFVPHEERVPTASTRPIGLQLAESEGGTVVVADIAPGSIADVADLNPGDRVHAINLQTIGSVAEAETLLADAADIVALAVSRGREDTRWILLGAAQDTAGAVAGNNQGPHSVRL